MFDDDLKPVKVWSDETGGEPQHSILASLYCVPVFLASLALVVFQLFGILSLVTAALGGAGPVGAGYAMAILLPFVTAYGAVWFIGCVFVQRSIVGAKAYLAAGVASLAIPVLTAVLASIL